MATFLRALNDADKARSLLELVRLREQSGPRRFEVSPDSFSLVSQSPFSYWTSDRLRAAFARHEPFEANYTAARGAYTTDDFRFYRLAWEISPQRVASSRAATRAGKSHAPLAKGGQYARYLASVHLLILWAEDGRQAKALLSAYRERKGWGTDWSAALNGYGHYFEPGLTWSRRSQLGLSFRALPSGCIFTDNGPAVFTEAQNPGRLLATLAVTNSTSFRALVDLQMAFGLFQVGVIQRTPVPELPPADEATLAVLARRAWSLTRGLDTRTETSHAFVLPALGQVEGETLAARSAAWGEHVRQVETEVAAIQTKIDERCFELYGIDEGDRRAITEGIGGSAGYSEAPEDETEGDAEAEDEAEAGAVADTPTLAAELMAWAVGAAFGRFDIRMATGARTQPAEPEPFDPLPVCSPAMLAGDDGLPPARPPAGYPLSFPEDGILVDDPGHPRDLTAAVRGVFDTVFGPRADAVWQEAAALLDPRGHDLRRWLASRFFEHHLKRHSKSRRKAPILWQLGIPSGRYSVWVYAHRLTRDSLAAIQNDIVAPKLAHEERRHASLVTQAGPTPSARDRAEIATQEAVVDELRVLLDEVRRVAPLWNPDLDDGIVLVMALLWRLVPGHRAWQKELKSRSDDLVAGKYDWAHLAMHLWPERVVPKCTTDRSLAIAHDLEGIFWIEGADGKWTRRSTPTRPLDELVVERTSPAVRAALASLLEAPGLAGSGARRKSSAGVNA